MALEILVYDLDAESRKLPTGCVYARAGAAWVVEAGRMRQLAANEPMWGPRGLIVEDAATNLLALSQPSSGSEWSQAGLYDFPQAVSMLAGGTALAHAAKGTSDAPVREIDDPLPDDAVALGTVWALVECIDNVYVDIGTRDGAQNWVDRARWAQPHGLAYPLPSDRTDMQALGRLRSEIGPNRGRLIELACVSPTGLDARKLGIAPTGDHQSHLRAVLHHVQAEAGPGPTSPIVTTSGAGTRNRATAIATVLSVGAQQTSLQILGQAPVWMGKRQVVWQMDADTDADGQRVALERTAAGQLQLVCGGALLDLGKLANGESFGVGLQVSGGTMRASRDGFPVVSVAASLPAATKERWGHGYAAGTAFSGETSRQRRWLSVATDEELRALSADTLALPGDQSTLTPPALYAADFAKARVPAALLENAVVPSSGAAALRLSYAGAGTPPRYVYRKGRSASGKQELPWHKGRRVENKWTAPAFSALYGGDGVAPTITTGRPDAFGGSTAVRIQASRVTQDALNYSGAAVSFAEGALAPAGGLMCVSYFARANGTPCTAFFSAGINSGTGASIAIGNDWVRVSPGMASPVSGVAHNVQILAYLATASLAIDIDVCGIQIEDMTGVAQAAASEYVDPTKIYNGGCAGVRWFAETCGNTLDGSYRVIEAAGAALPQPMGMLWQPAATSLIADSPPVTPFGELECTIGDSPVGVAGLPAKRITASANANVSRWIGRSIGSPTGVHTLYGLFRKPAGFGSRPAIEFYYSGGNNGKRIIISADWTTNDIQGTGVLAHGVVPLGDDCYYVYAVATLEGYATTAFLLLVDETGGAYLSPGEYLDVAAFNCIAGPYEGAPLLTSAGQVARGAENPLTALPAVGLDDFTVFVECTTMAPPTPGTSGMLFIPAGDDYQTASIYMTAGMQLAAATVGGYFALSPVKSVGQKIKAILRRRSGVYSLYCDGDFIASATPSPVSVPSPRFGTANYGWVANIVRHADRFWPVALSDAECAYRTNLGNP